MKQDQSILYYPRYILQLIVECLNVDTVHEVRSFFCNALEYYIERKCYLYM